MKKRILAMITAVCTAVSCFTTVGAMSAYAEETNVIFSDDFGGGDLAATGWKKTGGTTITDVGTEYGKTMKYQSRWDRFGVNIGQVTSGTLEISFDLNPDAFDFTLGNGRAFELCLLKNSLTSDIEADTANGDNYWTVLRLSKIGNEADSPLFLSPTNAVLNGAANNGWIEPARDCGVEVSEGEWTRVDIKVNLDDGEITYYFNGQQHCLNMSEELKTTFTSIGALLFRGNDFSADNIVYLDNFNIKTAGGSFDVKDTAVDENNGTIDVSFNSTISADTAISKDAVSVKKLGGDAVTVTDVQKLTGDKIRVSYSGNLEKGREYMVSVDGGIRSVYGDSLSDDILFNAAASTQSAHVAENFNDKTAENPMPAYMTTADSLDKETDPKATIVTGADGSNALKINRDPASAGDYDNMFLNLALSDFNELNGTTGKLNVSFDTYVVDWRNFRMMYYDDQNVETYFIMASRNGLQSYNKGTAAAAMTGFTCGQWNTIKVVFDCDNSVLEYYLNGEKVGVQTFSDLSPKADYAGYSGVMNKISLVSWIEKSASDYFLFDNIDIWREETAYTVSRVRFTDSNSNEIANDTLSNGVKDMKITFNKDMTESALAGNVVVKDSKGNTVECTGTLGADNRTYTLTPTAGEFAADTKYIATVDEKAGIDATVTYSFTVGNPAVDGMEITKSGNVYKISGKAANVDASVNKLTLLVGLYKSGVLQNVKTADVTVTDGNAVIETSVDASGIDHDSAKAFLWNSADGLKPIIDAAGYPTAK